jgi:Fe-S-cluster formation regulator IscX/YfhJ
LVVDRFVDLSQSSVDPGREQFTDLVDAICTGEYEYVII